MLRVERQSASALRKEFVGYGEGILTNLSTRVEEKNLGVEVETEERESVCLLSRQCMIIKILLSSSIYRS